MTSIESLLESLKRCHGLSFDLDALEEAVRELETLRRDLLRISAVVNAHHNSDGTSAPFALSAVADILGRPF